MTLQVAAGAPSCSAFCDFARLTPGRLFNFGQTARRPAYCAGNINLMAQLFPVYPGNAIASFSIASRKAAAVALSKFAFISSTGILVFDQLSRR